MHLKYTLESWSYVSDFGSGSLIYPTEQERLDAVDFFEIPRRIASTFRGGGNHGVSLETLRKIEALIQGGKSDAG